LKEKIAAPTPTTQKNNATITRLLMAASCGIDGVGKADA
jgi:hypothetical protein